MQDVNHQLFSESVLDEAVLGIKALPESREAMAEQVLSDLDLLDCKDAHPIIVLDEPTSGLDYRHMQEVASSIRKLSDMGKTQFVITHDPDLVVACCNYFVFMEAGKVVCSGYWNETNQKYIADYFGGL